MKLVRVEETEAQLLTLAGAFAAIAALFGGPLVAAFLLFEVTAAGGAVPPKMMGRVLLPGFVAAGTGALVFTGVGDWSGVHTESLSLPALPDYGTVRIADLAWCLVVSVAIAVRRGRDQAPRARACDQVGAPGRPRARGRRRYSSACSPSASVPLADRPVDLVLFSGQTELPDVIAEGSASVLLLLVVAKGLAYALSLGVAFRGGPVFPAHRHRCGVRRDELRTSCRGSTRRRQSPSASPPAPRQSCVSRSPASCSRRCSWATRRRRWRRSRCSRRRQAGSSRRRCPIPRIGLQGPSQARPRTRQ